MMNIQADSSCDSSVALSAEQRAFLGWLEAPLRVSGGVSLHGGVHLLQADLDGPLDIGRMRAAWDNVVRSHWMLGVAFRHGAGYRGVRAVPLSTPAPLAFEVVDLPDDHAVDLAQRCDALVDECRHRPLDIAAGSLLRVCVIRQTPSTATFVLTGSVLAVDRLSLHNLFDQFAAAYFSPATPAPRDVFQYPQYLEWRESLQRDDDAGAGRAYWRRYLDDVAVCPAPQLDYRHRSRLTDSVVRLRIESRIAAPLAASVGRLAQQHGVGVELVLQAIWWALLARLVGFTGFAGGWQHDCRRDYAAMQDSIGLFDKVLPLRVDLSADESFSTWLSRLARTLHAHTDAQEYWPIDHPSNVQHQVAGFAFVAAPRRHGNRSNVGESSQGGQWRLRELPGPLPCFELAMLAQSDGTDIDIALHADAGGYTPLVLERLQQQFVSALDAVVNAPSARLAEIALVDEAERATRLDAGAWVDFGTLDIGAHIARWAESQPDAPALENASRTLTYRQLDDEVARIAHWMRVHGVTAGSIVALDLPRSVELVIAILATWRVGACFLPLEPEWPESRRAAMLADARPALVLYATWNADAAPPAWPHAALDAIDLAASRASAPNPQGAVQVGLGDAAYVLYTSGSTGLPKGVVVEHGHLLNYVAAASSAMQLAACRRWGMTSSVAADLGHTALFCALFNGACLVVAQLDEARDARAFAHFVSTRGIDALKIVPSHLDALLEDGVAFPVRTLVLGGEAAPRALLERLRKLAPQCRIFNHYGPTETTIGVMVHALEPADALPDILPLSRALANNRVHVLDDALRLTPAGALGEVYVGGAQLCRGYLNRDDSGRFVADPFVPGQRLYRTGDLAYVLACGAIRLAGRADHQLKVRGFRVEPAEIEAVMLTLSSVRQAVVLPVSRSGAQLELAACVCVGPGSAGMLSGSVLRDQLTLLLPVHMVPASYVLVETFPRLTNGKIDRLALAAMLDADTDAGVEAPSRDALEFLLCASMANLLGRASIGIHADFFELGGHSLHVIKLTTRLRKLLQLDLPPTLVFDFPTPAALAEALREGEYDQEQLERHAAAFQTAAA